MGGDEESGERRGEGQLVAGDRGERGCRGGGRGRSIAVASSSLEQRGGLEPQQPRGLRVSSPGSCCCCRNSFLLLLGRRQRI